METSALRGHVPFDAVVFLLLSGQDLDSLRAIQEEVRRGPPRSAPPSGGRSGGPPPRRPPPSTEAASSERRDYLASTRSRMMVPTERKDDYLPPPRRAPSQRRRSRSRSRSRSPPERRRRERSPSPRRDRRRSRSRERHRERSLERSPSPRRRRSRSPPRHREERPRPASPPPPPVRYAEARQPDAPAPAAAPPPPIAPAPASAPAPAPPAPAPEPAPAAAAAPAATVADLNRLTARLLKAEMMGDADQAAALQAQIAALRAQAPDAAAAAAAPVAKPAAPAAAAAPPASAARGGQRQERGRRGDDGRPGALEARARPLDAGGDSGSESDEGDGRRPKTVVLAAARDEFGRPLQQLARPNPDNRPKLGKVVTHDKHGERLRYFRDDDNVSLEEMVRREKASSSQRGTYDRQLADQIARNTRFQVSAARGGIAWLRHRRALTERALWPGLCGDQDTHDYMDEHSEQLSDVRANKWNAAKQAQRQYDAAIRGTARGSAGAQVCLSVAKLLRPHVSCDGFHRATPRGPAARGVHVLPGQPRAGQAPHRVLGRQDVPGAAGHGVAHGGPLPDRAVHTRQLDAARGRGRLDRDAQFQEVPDPHVCARGPGRAVHGDGHGAAQEPPHRRGVRAAAACAGR